MTVDRIPPANLEAEKATLGSVLVDRHTIDLVAGIVQPSDFYAVVHEAIFRAMLDLDQAGNPLDKIAVAEGLRARGLLEKVGGLPYLSSLMDTVPTAASAEYYAHIVREKSRLRALIHAGSEIARLGFEGETDVDRAVSDAGATLQRATDRDVAAGGTALHVAFRRGFESLSELVHGTRASAAQLTPWAGLNNMIGGFYPGELIVWPSAPKMGKTAALTMLADYVAAHHGPTVVFALEMGVDATAARLVALHSGISARAQRLGELTDDDLERVAEAQAAIGARPITLYDLSCSSIADIRRELRAIAQRTPIAAVVVDGVNFIVDVDGARGDRTTKHERLDRVYRSLLRIAKEFGCVMHAVQHVSREGMRGRPTLADIRDGGNPEGHAHAVIFPFRPHPGGTFEERQEGEFIVAAAREGDAGTIPMRFIGSRGMWLDGGAERPWFEISARTSRA